MRKLTPCRIVLAGAVRGLAVWLVGLAIQAHAAEPATNAPPVVESSGLGTATNGPTASNLPALNPASLSTSSPAVPATNVPSVVELSGSALVTNGPTVSNLSALNPASSGTSGPVAPAGGVVVPQVSSSNAPAPQMAVGGASAVRGITPRTSVAGLPAAKPLPAGRDLSSFKIITDRNIFDPDRRARSTRGAAVETAAPAKVDSFSLVGIMNYAKGDFAFFDGTSAEFRKILKLADSIAGFKVQEIARNQVKLEAGGKVMAFPVGTQMRRQEAGEWQMSARTESYASNSAGGSGATSGTAGSAASGGESEILKRLMQQREKELKK